MKRCLIISGGEYIKILQAVEYEFCIACDKGFEHAISMGINPDLVIGDFDSVDEKIYKEIKKHGQVLKYPVEKDDTDTMLAIKKAIELGYDHIILCCALGGRLDHTIANIQSMNYAASHGVSCELYGKDEYLFTMTNEKRIIPFEMGKSLSVFALSDKCEGVTIKGAKYEIEDAALINAFPLGLGNSWKDGEIEIAVKTGVLLVVESKLE